MLWGRVEMVFRYWGREMVAEVREWEAEAGLMFRAVEVVVRCRG